MDFNGVFTGKLHSDHRTPLCGFSDDFLNSKFGTKFGNYLWHHNVNQDCQTVTKKCRISQATILPSFKPFGKFFTSLWPIWEEKHLFLTIVPVTLENNINREYLFLPDWLKANKLSLNALKSKFMLICSSRKRRQNFRVQLGNVELGQSNCLKYIWVYIEQHLAWNAHIIYVS